MSNPTAIRASNSKIWHLTDQVVTYARDEGAIKTRCNRNLTIPETDRNGYQFNQMHTWPINQDPKQAWVLCPKCGTVTDFMTASQQRWNEEKQRQQIQTEARQKAQAQAGEKASVLTDIWQQTLDSLSAIGWQIQKPQYRRHRATMQINGFTFETEFVRPDAAFGVNTATGEVMEMLK